MLLDLIATNNWERPIYFANPNAHAGVLNLDRYCHLEGVVYRLKPYVADQFVAKVGGVDPVRSFEVLMDESVRWGRLNEDDVIMDRESMRTVGIMKQNYIRLAQSLADQEKYDSVIQVLDTGLKFFPHEKIPYDYYMIPWASNYFKAGEKEKGIEVVKTIQGRYEEDLAYFSSLDKSFSDLYTDQVQESLAVLQRLGQVAREHRQRELAEELDASLINYIDIFGYE